MSSFGIELMLSLQDEFRKHFFLFNLFIYLWNTLRCIDVTFSLNVWWNSSVNLPDLGILLPGSVSITDSISLLVIGLHIFQFFLLHLGTLYISRNCHLLVYFQEFIDLFKVFHYWSLIVLCTLFFYPLLFCGDDCNFSSSISVFIYLGLSLFLFFMSLAKILSVLFIISKNQFLVSLICSGIFPLFILLLL